MAAVIATADHGNGNDMNGLTMTEVVYDTEPFWELEEEFEGWHDTRPMMTTESRQSCCDMVAIMAHLAHTLHCDNDALRIELSVIIVID